MAPLSNTTSPRVAATCQCLVGEGPVWCEASQRLLWVDIVGQAVYALLNTSGDAVDQPAIGSAVESQSLQRWAVPDLIGFLFPSRAGGYIAGLNQQLVTLSLHEQASVEYCVLDEPEPDRPQNRFNDGLVDQQGRVWCTTMNTRDSMPTGCLYCYQNRSQPRRIDEGYVVANGPVIDPTGGAMYCNETADSAPYPQGIYRYPLGANDTVGEPTLFVDYRDRAGGPDGMCVDREGRLWVAEFGGGGVTAFDTNGRAVARVDLPVTYVTKPAFGGPRQEILYITTASIALSTAEHEQEPHAGDLFAIHTTTNGIKPAACNG